MMDCSEVRDLLDAYALGAESQENAARLEAHVADCVRCWEELGKAQRTAALLAISVPLKEPPDGLEERVMARARQDEAGIRSEPRQPLLRRLGISWAHAAAGLGVASVAALAFAGILQAQVNDLRDENNRLESQLVSANQELQQRVAEMDEAVQSQNALIEFGLTSSETLEMKPAGFDQPASVFYSWTSDGSDGLVLCKNLPPPPAGQVYQVWFSENSQRVPVLSFTPEDGECKHPVDLTVLDVRPTGVGISLEDASAAADHPDGWLAYAHFPED